MTRYEAKMKDLNFRYVKDTRLPASNEAIEQLEQTAGFELPPDYLAFVKEYGGTGFEDSTAVTVPGLNGNENVAVSVFYGIGRKDGYDVLSEYDDLAGDNRIPPRMIPIAGTPGTSYFLLSLGESDIGGVFFWNQYEESVTSENDEVDESNLYHVADSFDDFIELLKPSEELATV